MSELTRRKQSNQLISKRFDFLSFPKEEDNIVEKCNTLKEAYRLHFQVIQIFRFAKEPFRSFLAKKDRESCDVRSGKDEKEVNKPTVQFLLELVINRRVLAIFPNIIVSNLTSWCCVWGEMLLCLKTNKKSFSLNNGTRETRSLVLNVR